MILLFVSDRLWLRSGLYKVAIVHHIYLQTKLLKCMMYFNIQFVASAEACSSSTENKMTMKRLSKGRCRNLLHSPFPTTLNRCYPNTSVIIKKPAKTTLGYNQSNVNSKHADAFLVFILLGINQCGLYQYLDVSYNAIVSTTWSSSITSKN